MKILRSLFAISAIVLPLLLPALRAAPDTVMPVFKTGATILFVGDSITDGGRARKGSDYNHTMGQSYAFILAAQLGNRLAERNLTFINRGISGERVPDLQQRWKTDVLDLKPDVLSILIGINDTTRANMVTTPEEFERGYDQLLADTLKALPEVRIHPLRTLRPSRRPIQGRLPRRPRRSAKTPGRRRPACRQIQTSAGPLPKAL
jgi:lysophospholipase L1-like esterase